MKKTIILSLVFLSLFSSLNAIPNGTLESRSRIDWVARNFISDVSMDTKKAGLQMPSGKKQASSFIKMKLPQLVQDPLLFLYADSSRTLSDYVITEDITLIQVQNFISTGYRTPEVFTNDASRLNTTNTLNIDGIGKFLIKHKIAYLPEAPIETVPSRPYTGIIIDARGKLPVHGEYIKDKTSPCFYPKIWDEKMNTVYERSMVNPDVIINQGLISYDYTENPKNYIGRIGTDPLFIKAVEVFGRNRTDPVISREDALKILTVPENIKLLQEGKVVILLDKESLVYDIAIPERNELFYVNLEKVRDHFLISAPEGVELVVDDRIPTYIVNLHFYPDSPKLLPDDEKLIKWVAEDIRKLIIDDGYTILVEGHTADVGKPVGQLNLSNDRAKAVVEALIKEGIARSILSSKGYGGTLPRADNSTEEGRAQNRRVEITVQPKATYVQRDW